ncbi:DUF5979 domain-containing protein, partial [Mycobacterium tuberculosis]|uniref:DUF5979 domain-containing protein n=1 Tax=Mycobacterium tuberculosis TaxID=1773 RepID=UPI000AA14241
TPPVVGGFTVAKAVTGEGASLVPPGQEFTVSYSYELNKKPVTGELVVKNGETVGLDKIPAGTVVTVKEKAPAAVEGVIWQAPVFSGSGVTTSGDAATFTIADNTTIAVA